MQVDARRSRNASRKGTSDDCREKRVWGWTQSQIKWNQKVEWGKGTAKQVTESP